MQPEDSAKEVADVAALHMTGIRYLLHGLKPLHCRVSGDFSGYCGVIDLTLSMMMADEHG